MSYTQTMRHTRKHPRAHRVPITLGQFGPEKRLYDFFCKHCGCRYRTYSVKRFEALECEYCKPDFECVCGFTTSEGWEIKEHGAQTQHVVYARYPNTRLQKE
jgi:hypothetical protein